MEYRAMESQYVEQEAVETTAPASFLAGEANNLEAANTAASPVASEAAADSAGLLNTLENRWGALADTIYNLRSEKSELQRRVQEDEERMFQLEGELEELRLQLEIMNEEKVRTIARIEKLLVRFDGLDGNT
ncbi:MAG: cell division protein ZapB [Magnetococcales bacterium]|nr:cell division protein ZapB [Magnetococcales bacterium]